jgi:predicted dinucleotide-binding enzyme/predicted ester cyclase
MLMRIGIIGSGKMGSGLGRLWTRHGHHVMISYSRNPERLRELAEEVGTRAGTPQEAARFGDVLLLAVPWNTIGDALVAAGPLEGKTLISCVNPLGTSGLEVGMTSSAAEEISKLVPGAFVVEAFNTIFAGLLHSSAHHFKDSPPTVFYCGDHRTSKSTVAELIADAGFHAIDAGPLQNARYLEPVAMLLLELAYSQLQGSDIALRFMNPAGPRESVVNADSLATSFADIYAGPGDGSEDSKILAEDFVAHIPFNRHPVRGRERFKIQLKQFRSAFSNFQCHIDEVVVDGNHVAVRWTWRGTHTGTLLGIAPTNRRIAFSETHLLRISGGRLVEDHVSANLLDLLTQLGAMEFAAA